MQIEQLPIRNNPDDKILMKIMVSIKSWASRFKAEKREASSLIYSVNRVEPAGYLVVNGGFH